MYINISFRASAMHNEMKNAMESKVQSMEALIQEKTTSLDRILSENEQLQHKTQTLESRLSAIQTELTESTKKYDELHQNFVQKVGCYGLYFYTVKRTCAILIFFSCKLDNLEC